jgi:alkylhydroperoxidase/carboxymuconolactone decarboxylase family protein YurZ
MFVRWQGEQEPRHGRTADPRPAAARRLRTQDGPAHRRRPVRGRLEAPGLSPRDRSLVTAAVLAATCRPGQLISHLRLALANGLTQDELVEALTHLAFYAGWPSGMAALTQLKTITAETGSGASR